jgi:hypothetical protein
MVWHYVKDHHYKLPKGIYGRIITSAFALLQDGEVRKLIDGATAIVDIPYLTFRAMWKKERYKSLTVCHQTNQLNWILSEVSLRDGYYTSKLHVTPTDIITMFEDDPGNFPDKIEVVMENANNAHNKIMSRNKLPR